tara:strand:- start:500 stop:676 length:177 start_codon:yes stop_codon:yes gene_type:complete
MYVSYYQVGGSFDLTEYVIGENNCCNEHPVSLCGENGVYFEIIIRFLVNVIKNTRTWF